jgi:hypothetical protein
VTQIHLESVVVIKYKRRSPDPFFKRDDDVMRSPDPFFKRGDDVMKSPDPFFKRDDDVMKSPDPFFKRDDDKEKNVIAPALAGLGNLLRKNNFII